MPSVTHKPEPPIAKRSNLNDQASLPVGSFCCTTMQGLIRPTQSRHSYRNSKWEVLGQPPYSPDLSPCDYAIFCPLKKALRGKRSTSDDDVEQYVRNWFTTQPREFYEAAIHHLVSQRDRVPQQPGLILLTYRYCFCS